MTTFEYVEMVCAAAQNAAPTFSRASGDGKNKVLLRIASLLSERADTIISENAADLAVAAENGVPEPMLDRLKLDRERIDGIRASLAELAQLPDPIGSGTRNVRPNGLVIEHIRVPLGVVAVIYEARPNVTIDAAALCLKTGNACILRGGKEAINTNRVLVAVMREALSECGFPADTVWLIDDTTRESATILMTMRNYIDLLIPRGGRGLIKSVVENATVPVIETGAGNCHLYVEKTADIDMAIKVALNAKLSRPSVCNAIETLLVDEDIAEEFLPRFKAALTHPLEIRGCDRTCEIIDCVRACDADWNTEYDDYILAVRVVSCVAEAIDHINQHNTKHSECIITRDMASAERFRRDVDAAAVYVNASTRFTDGGEFGFGAELGISTQKLHARGPMGLEALTTGKYLITGNGQVR